MASLKRSVKRSWWKRRTGLAAILACGLVVGGGFLSLVQWSKRAALRYFALSEVTVAYSQIYNVGVKREIGRAIREAAANANFLFFQADGFYSSLKKRFSTIEKVVVRKLFPKGLNVLVVGTMPMCRVNSSLVLAANGRVYERDIFKGYRGALQEFSVPALFAGACCDEVTIRCLARVPAKLTDAYAVEYQAASRIILRPKNAALYAQVIADEASLFDEHKMSLFEEITQDVAHRGLCSRSRLEKKRTVACYDIRFSNRIIVKFFDRGRGGNVS